MEIHGLGFFVLLMVTWVLLGISAVVTFTITLGHNRKPFISDTALECPEWIIYKIVFFGSSILGAAIVYLQYKFMLLRSEPSAKRFIIGQKTLLASGCIICIGTIVNAIYTIRDNALLHRIGAGAAFVFGILYNISQAALLYKRSYSCRVVCHIRLATAIVTFLVLLLFFAGQGALYIEICTGRCETIFYVPVLVAEYLAFVGITVYHVTNFTDFQHLSVKLTRKGINLSLRANNPDL